jgi:hypothetical protein
VQNPKNLNFSLCFPALPIFFSQIEAVFGRVIFVGNSVIFLDPLTATPPLFGTTVQPRARAEPLPLPHDELGTNARHACWEGAQGHNLKTLSDTFSNGSLSQKKRSPSIRTRPG